MHIIESNKQIQTLIMQAIARELNNGFPGILSNIKKKIGDTTMNVFRVTGVYASLVNGRLSAEFGFPRGSGKNRVDHMLRVLVDMIQVEYTPLKPYPSNKGFSGGLNIGLLKKDLTSLISHPSGQVTATATEVLPWLKWLLFEGDSIIVADYEFVPGPGGRSGDGIMMKSSSKFWRVPPEYAGYDGHNWLTRTFQSFSSYLEKSYTNIVEYEIGSVIS